MIGGVVGEAVEVVVFVVDIPFFAGPLVSAVPPVSGVTPGAAVVEDFSAVGAFTGEDFEGVMGVGVDFDGDGEWGAIASQGQRAVASRWRALVGAAG